MESSSLEVFKKMTGYGTQCHGLVDEEMLGHRLNLMFKDPFQPSSFRELKITIRMHE